MIPKKEFKLCLIALIVANIIGALALALTIILITLS